MVDTDSAFLWETEALRQGTQSSYEDARSDEASPADDVEWVTLRQANQLTGIPTETLRKWARRNHVDSYMARSAAGERRMVSIDDVRSRATKLGRTDVTPEIDLSEKPRSPASPEVQPGTMLVPIEAWDKMLLQLGNLHQAGQQLAEARERAAKAETEAKFLKERLSDMRAEIADLKEAGTPRQTPHPPPDPAPTRMTRIPIESDDDDVEPIELNEIPTAETEPTVSADDAMTLRAYSFEMAKHLYSTWRQRPKR